jgi:hypothetical protein
MLVFSSVMPETLPISLIYDGKDVENGSMPLGEVIDALEGFSGAYGKVASLVDSARTHEIRVTAVKEGSFKVDLVVFWGLMVASEGPIKTIETVIGGAKYVYGLIADVIKAKKHVRNEPYTVSIPGSNNTVLLLNQTGGTLSIPLEALEILRSRLIDQDLKKIVSPLKENSIDTVQLKSGSEPDETISASDREYFRVSSVTTSKEAELRGTLVSYNKDSRRGLFRLGDLGVPYRYVGDAQEQILTDFSYTGTVEVRCIAHFDESLSPTLLEISKVKRIQLELPLSSSEPISPNEQT